MLIIETGSINILNQVETYSYETVLKQWEELLTDMYGDDQTPKHALFNEAMNDDKINQAAKNWLKKYNRGCQHAK